jgi:hypothetical protein
MAKKFSSRVWNTNWDSVVVHSLHYLMIKAGNTKGGSITVPLTSSLTGLDLAA